MNSIDEVGVGPIRAETLERQDGIPRGEARERQNGDALS